MTKPNPGAIDIEALCESIRNEPVDPAVEAETVARVRSLVFAAAADPTTATLQSCADFQALMRPYLTKTLAESRAMLLEDHVHSCVNCRRELAAARTGKVRTMPRPRVVERELPLYLKYAAAAVVLMAAGLTTWGVMRMLPSSGARATVQSVSGILYAVSDQSSAPVCSGRDIGDGQLLRTARNSTALLRLTDGSLVEMNERAELSISKNARGTNIRLGRGNVIVQAAKQKKGALYVSTPDCLVTVHGTVFAVTRGVKGTRVSVAQGEVKVDEGGRTALLHPGDQTATSPSIEDTSIHDDFAWSRNSAKYLALLGEISTLQKRLAEIPAPGLRYKSKLLDLVPDNTVIYAAIPNLGNTLAEASRLFSERMEQSEVLREWWARNQPKGGHGLDDMVNRLRMFSSYLGDEVVLAITAAPGRQYRAPLLLAEVKNPGLKEFLEGQARELSPNGHPAFRFIDDPAAERSTESGAKSTPTSPLVMTIKNDVLAIGSNEAVSAFTEPNRRGFDDTYFHEVISQSYQSGVGWLFCANLEQILRNSVFKGEGETDNNPTGLQDVRYLIYERKEKDGQTQNRIALNFRGDRRGLASWLGAPGPMGALDFVSPNALVASGVVLRNPRALLSELFTYAKSNDSNFAGHLADFEQRSGISVLDDLAGPLGTDAAFAIDGPIFPVPNWEFAMEVYSPDRLEWTIEKLVDDFNRESGTTKITLSKNQVGDRTFYSLTGTNVTLEAHYTFVDGYFVAGATQGIVLRAIQNRQNGFVLARSEKFRSLLPRDTYASFSGLIYHNVGPLIGPIAEQLKSLSAVTPAQRASIEALEKNTGPGMIYAYGEPNRIVVSGNGPLFGLGLETLAAPNIIANTIRMESRFGRQGK